VGRALQDDTIARDTKIYTVERRNFTVEGHCKMAANGVVGEVLLSLLLWHATTNPQLAKLASNSMLKNKQHFKGSQTHRRHYRRIVHWS
jgi:hypothetical protein